MAISLGTALIGSAVIGGAASVIGGNKASKAQQQATAANNALQTQIYNSNKGTLDPYISRGNDAGGLLQQLIMGGQGAQDAFRAFQSGTGYQTTLGEALGSVNSNAYARGMGDSGATMKALQDRAGQVAQGSFGQYAGLLGNQQGVGLSAASALAGVGQGYANNVSANNNAAATARGNAALNTAGQINGILGNVTGALAYQNGLGSSYNNGGGRPPVWGEVGHETYPYGGKLGGIY